MKFLKNKPYVSIGFMLFAMFFGAGNLIFPAILGQNAGSNLSLSMIGLILTGVGLPLLGVLVIGYSGANDLLDLSSRAGKLFGLFFTTALYLTIGPFFAIPRTGTTTFSLGVSSFISEENQSIALMIFLAIFMGLTLLLSVKQTKLVDIIGNIITPVLLVSIAILIIKSIFSPMGGYQAPLEGYETSSGALTKGILEGYNTMDALASLVFGIVVINAVKLYGAKSSKEIFNNTSKAAVIAAILLGIIYVFIANIGATGVSVLGVQETGAGILSGATDYYFSGVGRVLLFVIVFLACLTTSVGLTTACSSYFNRIYPKISYNAYAVSIVVFSFVVGQVGLSALITYAVPVLIFLYPLTIILIFLGLFNNFFGGKKEVYVYTILFTVVISAYITITSTLKLAFPAVDNLIAKLPLQQYEFGWLTISLLGFIVGLVVSNFKKSN